MIVVEAKLISAISPSRDATLCRVEIANDGTGTDTRRNYKVKLFSRGDQSRLIREVQLQGWPAKARPAWRLVEAAFAALGSGPETPTSNE
jgi:hypothetical protein